MVLATGELKFAVFVAATKMLKENPNMPIDEYLFEIVGGKYAIGKTLAAEYYYEAKASF